MNKAEREVIQQALYLARDLADPDASNGDKIVREILLIGACAVLVKSRKRHKKRGEKVKHPAGIVPYDKSLERFTKTL